MITMNNIEISKLYRQFLFKRKYWKIKILNKKDSVKLMNHDFNVESMQDLEGPETENIFTKDFLERNNFIINTINSINARQYIVVAVVVFKKRAIDSGTRGVFGNS